MSKRLTPKNELCSLRNVGPATYRDLEILEISTIQQLTDADPDELYARLQEITGHPHDPCVWDVFAAIIHEAKTGEKPPWWQWTAVRKKRKSNETNEL
ncbi:MAG: TfoX/Sxy family DNA transformation protein [Alphaproteobacteria bacterium]|nr:TfoX/Sxy family DNA transformation protein [Alphaproteobacteria bacterium]